MQIPFNEALHKLTAGFVGLTEELRLIHGGSDMPIFVKLNLKNTLLAPVVRHTTMAYQLNSIALEYSVSDAANSVVSCMRQQTRIIQRAAANAFFDNCAHLETDLSLSAKVLSNIFSNIVSARHEIINLPGLNHKLTVSANPKSSAAK